MEINVQSIKFDADSRLLEFIQKKVEKLPRFFDNIQATDVVLSLLSDPANKNVKIKVRIPGSELVVERNAPSFETALNECVDVLKEQLKRKKEMMQG